MNLFFIHGRPACGKDTVCSLLQKDIPNSFIISGVYRSAFIKVGDYAKYHDLIAPHIKPLGQGIDMPGNTVLTVFQDIINARCNEGCQTLFVCGLLRATPHAEAVNSWLSQETNVKSKHIYLITSEGRALQHAERRQQAGDETGCRRVDDTPELMAARLARFRNNSIPMLRMLRQEGQLTIIRADKPIDEVHKELRTFLIPELSIQETFTPSSYAMRR